MAERATLDHPHLVLVGLPGSGKSTVGRILATRLQRPFLDLDTEIVRRHGAASVAELFARHGEPWFRERERALSVELARAASPMVLAPGGGWMTNPGCLNALREHAVLVYLRVSVRTAHTRMKAESVVRPLLAVNDPEAELATLLTVREPTYLQSNHVVSTDSMSPDEVADTIVVLAGV